MLRRLVFTALVLSSFGLHAQGSLTVAPGLTITNGSIPYALDSFGGKSQLVPIHHSTVEINNHKGANIAGSVAGSFFYKPKLTTELAGLHARSIVHTTNPVFFFFVQQDEDTAGDTDKSNTATWAIAHATLTKDHRVFAKVQFTQLTGNAKRSEGLVDSQIDALGNGWFKLTPKAPLEPGEYAITPVFKVQNTYSTVVYDFSIDTSAANTADAVSAE